MITRIIYNKKQQKPFWRIKKSKKVVNIKHTKDIGKIIRLKKDESR